MTEFFKSLWGAVAPAALDEGSMGLDGPFFPGAGDIFLIHMLQHAMGKMHEASHGLI